jgi:hypothetical protein
MADFNYDSPQYNVRQFTAFRLPATTASTPVLKYVTHCAMKIKRITGIVFTAGTNASAGYDIYNGTTSVGAVTFGTGTANTVASLTQDISLSSAGWLEFRTKANSATMVVDATVEFETPYPADLTA